MICYQLHSQVQFDAYENYVQWLRQDYIPGMLKLPGFLNAELLLQKGGAMVSSSKDVKVIFWLKDESALKTYMAEHAMDQRQKGVDKFPGQFSSQREIWLQAEKF